MSVRHDTHTFLDQYQLPQSLVHLYDMIAQLSPPTLKFFDLDLSMEYGT